MMMQVVSWRPETLLMLMLIYSLLVEQVCNLDQNWQAFRMGCVEHHLLGPALPHGGVYMLDGVIEGQQLPELGLQGLTADEWRWRSPDLDPSWHQ